MKMIEKNDKSVCTIKLHNQDDQYLIRLEFFNYDYAIN